MTLGQSVEEVASRLSRLMELHLKLARLELAQDAKQVALNSAGLLAVLPAALLGYGLLMGAAVVVLDRALALDAALLIVGLVNVAVAVGGALLALRGIRATKPLNQLREEVGRDVETAKAARAELALAVEGTPAQPQLEGQR